MGKIYEACLWPLNNTDHQQKAKKERSRKLTVGKTQNMISHNNNHSDEHSQGS